jgi:CheY-like chemotaxis protein
MVESKVLEALFPGARRLMLCAMFGEPDRWWSLEELAGCAGVRPATQQAYLMRLRRAGIVRERTADGASRFQPEPACSIYADLRTIIVKLTQAPVCGETILVVEDTEATAQITRILLESWGYVVLEAHSPIEALDLFESHADEIQLLLTDVLMPEMSGPQLADELRRSRPNLPVVLMSGSPEDPFRRPSDGYLAKPFNPWSLSQMVRKTLDGVSCPAQRINTP